MTLSGKLATVGVQLVVEGLSSFRSKMTSAAKSVTTFEKKGSLLGKVFSGVTRVLGGFLKSLIRIGEFVVAGIILRGIDAMVRGIKALVGTVIEAGLEFQELTLRIQQFAAQEAFKQAGGAITFQQALDQTKEAATALLDELALFAIRSPFDTIDVVKIFSLSKAFGFAGENAKEVTKQALNMAAGLGIGAQGAERVIRNLGQMNRLGRVMQRDLNDLANAGINVAAIMDRVAENMGVTTESLKKLQAKGLVPASEFLKAFSQIADEEFAGASERMNKTLKAALGNLKDLTGSFVGLKVVKPVLDVLGERLAGFLDIISSGARGDKLIKTLNRIGTELGKITETFFGGVPSGESLADLMIGQLETLAERLGTISTIIGLEGFKELSTKEKLKTVLGILGMDFLLDPIDAIGEIKSSIENTVSVIRGVISQAMEGFEGGGIRGLLFEFVPEESTAGGVIESILTTLEKLKKFWDENKDNLLKIWTELIFPFTEIVLDVGLAGLGIMVDALGRLADWARKNPEIATFIIGLAAGLKTLAIIASAPIAIKISLLLGGAALIFDLITGNPTIFDEFIKNAQVLAQGWITAFVLGIVNSKAFAFFNDKVVKPIADLMGKSIPTSTDIARRLNEGLTGLNAAGVTIGNNVKTGVLAGLNLTSNDLNPMTPEILAEMQSLMTDSGHLVGGALVKGMVDGISNSAPLIKGTIEGVGGQIIETAKKVFIISSPSKVFEAIGQNISLGLAQGILGAAGAPVQAINVVGASVNMGAQTPSVVNNTTTQNFNQTINTNARSEPIAAGFRQMESIMSAG